MMDEFEVMEVFLLGIQIRLRSQGLQVSKEC
jgi:hypothetical protein